MANFIATGFFTVLMCMLFGLIAWFCKAVDNGPLPLVLRCVLLPVGLLGLYLAALALALVLGVFLFMTLAEICRAVNT